MNDRQFFFSRILVGQHLFVGKRLGMHFHLGVPWKVQQQSQKHPSNPSMLHPCFPMVGTSPKLLKKRGKKPVVKLACNPSSDPHLVAFFLISDFSCFFLKKLQDPKTLVHIGPTQTLSTEHCCWDAPNAPSNERNVTSDAARAGTGEGHPS